jgi:hypothetical protein
MTLISIIGDFHSSILPISYNFKEQMDKHIIVYDDAKCDVKNARISKSGKKRFQFTKGDQARAQYGRIGIYQEEVFNEERFLNAIREWFLE